MERLWMLVFQFPGAFRAAGRAITTVAFALGCSGWYLGSALARAAGVAARAGVETPTVLAEVYPNLPTWFIPETPIGFTLVVLLFLVGASIALMGRWAERVTR